MCVLPPHHRLRAELPLKGKPGGLPQSLPLEGKVDSPKTKTDEVEACTTTRHFPHLLPLRLPATRKSSGPYILSQPASN